MICLAIETTARHLGLGLYVFEKTGPIKARAEFFKEAPAQQSELLIPTLEKLLRSARLKRGDISLIAVNVGPGSFTGVRVGMATARTLAQALRRPLAGVNALEAMAWPEVCLAPSMVIVPVIPALAGEVYFAAYHGPKTLFKPAWKKERDLAAFLNKNKKAARVSAPVHPSMLAQIAVSRFRANPRSKAFDFSNVAPMYLQPSWAERTKPRS